MSTMTEPQLFPTDWARTRRNNPLTSHMAADTNQPGPSMTYVLDTLRIFGAKADHELVALHEDEAARFDTPYRFTPQRLRSARADLVKAGLVEWTGGFTPTVTGRLAQVWQAVR